MKKLIVFVFAMIIGIGSAFAQDGTYAGSSSTNEVIVPDTLEACGGLLADNAASLVDIKTGVTMVKASILLVETHNKSVDKLSDSNSFSAGILNALKDKLLENYGIILQAEEVVDNKPSAIFAIDSKTWDIYFKLGDRIVQGTLGGSIEALEKSQKDGATDEEIGLGVNALLNEMARVISVAVLGK